MKHLSSLLFFIICLNSNAQKQTSFEYGVIYNETLLTENLKNSYPEIHARNQQQENRVGELNFFLNVENQRSLFFHPQINKEDFNLFVAMQNTFGEHVFYNDLSKEESTEKFLFWGSTILIEEKINKQPWILCDESKKIDNYTCFRATKEFTDEDNLKVYVEAWYTPEIPIKFGPKQFVGLPGLIIELKENHLTYYLKSINYYPNAPIEIEKPKKGRKMTREEFANNSDKIKRKAKDAIINARG